MRSKNPELMQDMIDFIDEVYNDTGRTPTYKEIANEFNITDACVSKYINEMAKRDMLEIRKGSRGILTKNMQRKSINISNVPVVGSIACGTPLLAEENIESYLPISRSLLGSGEYFILKANGNSMINANIEDGDLVIVKQQESAEQGQIVVALIEGEATLKRYYLDEEEQKVRLHPENDELDDMYFDRIVIQGVAKKVIKDLT